MGPLREIAAFYPCSSCATTRPPPSPPLTVSTRAQVISGCGTGKTLMAIHGVAKLLADAPGSVVLTFPTLGLLEQTYQVWRAEAPFKFSALAVCSQHIANTEDIHSDELSVHSTTCAEQLAQWLVTTAGVRVVFTTYQSAGVLVAAHAKFRTGPFTVMVCDEAHRTAGRRGKPFAAVLDDRKIPAQHRLFFTATPKVNASRDSRAHRRTVSSMDNHDLYGRRVFSLPTREAIDRGILSPFKVAVIAVADSAVASAMKDLRLIRLAAAEQDSARADHVAAAIALTQAAHDYQLSSVLAFHNTIAASQDFATTFTRTHALLSARGLTGDHRTATVTHIDGTSPLRERKAAAEDILGRRNPDRWNIVTNARCITEGIDIPALDAVFFAEPRSSDVDVAQAVGRAIRKNPHHDRPALVVLALTIDDSLDAESVITISQFKKARQVLAALQSHDPTIATDLTRLREILADPLDVSTDLIDVIVPTDLPGPLVEQFLRAFSIHSVDTLTQQFEENFVALVAYSDQHGHASPLQQYRTPDGLALGQWVSGQRRAYQRNRLPSARVARFEQLPGWAWNAHDALWEAGFAELAAYAETHGHSYPPRTTDSFLNQWVITQRRPRQREHLSEERRKRLEDLPGWSWAHRQIPVWDRNFDALAAYAAEHGHADPPSDYVTNDGIALGVWARELRRPTRRAKLADARQDRLEALPGWSWTIERRRTWEESYTALVTFAAHHGHAAPAHTDREDDRALATWVAEQRHAHSKGRLTAKRAARLATLPGWVWTRADARWEQNFAALAAYAAQHGHTDPPPTYQSESGNAVLKWLSGVRRAARAGDLDPGRLARLEALPGWSPTSRRTDPTWDRTFDELLAYAAEHGHACPPQYHRTSAGTSLGSWVSNQRRAYRDGSMKRRHPGRTARLETLPGWCWNAFEALWENGFHELQHYYCTTHGSATPATKYVSESGHGLGQWTQDQRRKYRRGQLDERRIRRLEALPGWRWN
nr:DEAD/DEAH box helicase [Mycobacterium liflandii]